MTTQIQTFQFNGKSIQVINKDNQAWFIAKEVAEILGYNLTTNLTRILDDDEKGIHNVNTPSGNQDVIIINESGLYHAAIKSRKPEVKPFRKWVTAEVLPQIRKTGSYTAAPQKQPESEVKYVNPNDDPILKTVMSAMVEHAQRVKNGEITEYQPKPKKARSPKFTRSEFELMAKMLTYAKEWANIQKMLCNAPNSSPEAQEWLQKFNNVYTSYVTNPKDGGFVLFFKPNVTDDVNEFADWLKLQSKTL